MKGKIKTNFSQHDSFNLTPAPNTDGMGNCLQQPGQLSNQPIKSIRIAPVNISEFAVIKMMDCKQIISFWNETSCYRETEVSQKANEEKMSSRIDPSIGANRSIYQTALRCFPTMREVLSGQEKGVVKETLQVFI